MAANAALSYAFFVVLGAVGIAIATALAGWINVALLATELKRRGEFELDAAFRRAFVGIALGKRRDGGGGLVADLTLGLVRAGAGAPGTEWWPCAALIAAGC